MKLCPKCLKHFSDDANFCPVDAARLNPIEGSAAGGDSLSARFSLGEKLGGKRTGSVHRAVDKQGGAAVAVKLVAPEVIALPGVAQRLERELKQLERVHSAGVARVLASGKRGEETWVALEILEGAQTLADAITARGPIDLEQAAHLIEVIGEALIEAAQVGVVHRDLAPKNVLFTGTDIKLINFSLPVPTTDRVPGVPEFVAPEQVDGKPVDQRSNLYSLGALYYYVLTGQTVHAGSVDEVHRAHVSGAVKTPSSLAPVPAAVEAVIMRALDRSPTKRFLTVRQFVDEVGRVARGENDVRSTQPFGKVRPKAELVQTLLGVRSGMGTAPAPAPAVAAAPAPVAASIVAAPVIHAAPVAPVVAPAAAMAPSAAIGQSTVIGMASGAVLGTQPSTTDTPTHLKAPPMSAAVAVAAPSPIAMPSTHAAVPPPERSPWAPPGAMAGAPEVATPVPAAVAPTMAPAAAPVVAPSVAPAVGSSVGPAAAAAAVAPSMAAPAPTVPSKPVITKPPVVAPAAAPAAAGKKSKGGGDGESKGKFRETMWFKKGELDAQAAQVVAEEVAKTGKAVSTDKADSLPIDERYKDDGSITRGDKEKYSLRTGGTQMMTAMKEGDIGGASGKVSEDALIGEMKGGRQWIFIGIIAALLGIALILFVVFR